MRSGGRPCHDDRALFELLTLEGTQAGLSWNTILNKREGYRRAFDNFEIERVAGYSDADVERLLGDAGIVRNRLKVASTASNAQAIIRVREDFGGARFAMRSCRRRGWWMITRWGASGTASARRVVRERPLP